MSIEWEIEVLENLRDDESENDSEKVAEPSLQHETGNKKCQAIRRDEKNNDTEKRCGNYGEPYDV